MHSRDLLKAGLSVDKLVLVQAWSDADGLFSTRGRVALTWAETVTRVAETGVPDADYASAAAYRNSEGIGRPLRDVDFLGGSMTAYDATQKLRVAEIRGVPAGDTPNQAGKAKLALLALFFFSADQTGIGPFFSVYLIQHGWKTGMLGTVMTIGGLTGLAMAIPAGVVVDRTTRKRTYVIIACATAVIGSLMVWASQSVAMVVSSQIIGAVGGAAIGPAMLALTLGVVGQKGFSKYFGRNQAFNHAGNLGGAAVSGFLGWKFGFTAVFIMGAILGTTSILCTLAIPRAAVDDHAARGLRKDGNGAGRIKGFAEVLKSRPLLLLAACVTLWSLGNGAMLPLYGLSVVQANKVNPALFTALVVMVAQAVMVLSAITASRLIRIRGYWIVLTISFAALPLRGLLAATLTQTWGVLPVQALDGLGAGMLGVGAAGLATRMLDGTGRVNAGQGALGAVSGIGGAMSPALGGWLVQALGYPVAFITLGSLSLGALTLWIMFRRTVVEACRRPPELCSDPSEASLYRSDRGSPCETT